MARLIIMENPGKTRQVPLEAEETTIGRAPTNGIVIDGERVSRVHATIIIEPAFIVLKDHESRNGTYVNGQRIETQALVDGDTIKIGSCEMRFLAGDQEYSQIDALRLLTVPGLLIDIDRRQPTQPTTQPKLPQ